MSETLANMEKLGGIDYSTEEQWTGLRWIDGKKIYQKTINFGTLPNTATKSVAHNIINLKNIININGFGKKITTGTTIPLPTVQSGHNVGIWVNASNVYIETSSDRTDVTECYVTIQYTKTTD